MNFNEYQEEALKTAIYPEDMAIPYCAMKLCGEAGEVAEKIAKVYRDNGGVFTVEKMEEIAKELGDVLWYLANLSQLFIHDFDEVAQMNLDKLADRQQRGKLGGNGDDR